MTKMLRRFGVSSASALPARGRGDREVMHELRVRVRESMGWGLVFFYIDIKRMDGTAPFSRLMLRLRERGLNGFSNRVSKISPGSEFSGHAGRA